MTLAELKAALGVERFVWIDDQFGQPRTELQHLIRDHPLALAAFEELADLVEQRDYIDDFPERATQIVADLGSDREEEIRQALLQADAAGDAANEVPKEQIDAACDALGIAAEDRLTFDEGDGFIGGINPEDAAKIALIVDLKDAGGAPDRGLSILERCQACGFTGLAFILTHEATVATESAREADWHEQLVQRGVDKVPLTVIAKDRLAGQGQVDATLAVALKRAGLRQALHNLLDGALGVMDKSFNDLRSRLVRLDPERLETYVFGTAENEGEAELNVIERALASGVSREVRRFMALDDVAIDTIRKLRALREVKLDRRADEPGDILSDLQEAERWDEGEVINNALRPLANGDVFQMDASEPGVSNAGGKIFVLLAQPCDIQLRPDGKRVSETGMLVPLSPDLPHAEPPDPGAIDVASEKKDTPLPFRLLNAQYRMRLREIAYVRLSVLDLATFRGDGRVMVEENQAAPADLLAGARAIYDATINDAITLMASSAPAEKPTPETNERLLLTMASNTPWKQARMAIHQRPLKSPALNLQRRVTWRLRRIGRVRPPYSSFMLDRVLGLLGRRAFDADYAPSSKPGEGNLEA